MKDPRRRTVTGASAALAPGLASEAATPPVVFYTTTYCGYCRSAEALLEQRGIPYRKIDVTRDPAARTWLVKTTGRWTVPQLFVHGRSIGGYTDLARLDRSGELAELLAAGPPATGDEP